MYRTESVTGKKHSKKSDSLTGRIGFTVHTALLRKRYIDTLRQSQPGVARGRPPYNVPMLQSKSEDEPMVTKKKSKIPCLSLSSFLPALEGTVDL
jgi:hypothetical protein